MFVKQIQMQFTDIDGNGTVNLSEFCDLVNIIYATIGSISPRVSKQPAPASEPTATPKPFPEPLIHNCELTDEQYLDEENEKQILKIKN